MIYHMGMKISLFDEDNNENSMNYEDYYMGVWWYKDCHHANLNGLYLQTKPVTTHEVVSWQT